ncbi:MAG: hypothetical protein ACI9UU_002377, partial [Candidatus Azotimanducaceae bacterium]
RLVDVHMELMFDMIIKLKILIRKPK